MTKGKGIKKGRLEVMVEGGRKTGPDKMCPCDRKNVTLCGFPTKESHIALS